MTEEEIVENFLREREESFRLDGNSGGGEEKDDSLDFDDGEVWNFEDDTALTEDIRKMARALAPQMSELEDVLKDFSEAETADALDGMNSNIRDVSRSTIEEEDDDLDDEMEKLAMSEQSLREELQFAADMSMLGTPIAFNDDDDVHNNNKAGDATLPSPVNLNDQLKEQQQSKLSSSEIQPSMYTLKDYADYLQLKRERTGKWYYCDMTAKLLPSVLSESPSNSNSVVDTNDLVKDYCLPIPFRKLKRLYGGLVFYDVWEGKKMQHRQSVEVQKMLRRQSLAHAPATPERPLEPIKVNGDNKSNKIEEPLPVRTISIRVRPDVLCGAIMDAAHNAFEVLSDTCTTHIIKRQGAHLRGAVYLPKKQLAFVVDVQICTQKSDSLERRLLLRFYHIQDDPDALFELGQILQRKLREESKKPLATPESSSATTTLSSSSVGDDEKNENAGLLKQTCSLIQRLMAAEKQEGGIQKMTRKQQSSWLGLGDSPFDSESAMQSAIGAHLESNFKSCPSVREENKKASATIRRLTLPSLSKRDWPMVEVSSILTNYIVEELDTRDCSYNTLSTLPFGQFPCLSTLDLQYCSQLRRLSRENMIAQLLKTAKELEQYTGLAEYKCAVCITLLDPMMERYGVPALSLPKPKPLDGYPLDYTPPQTICPPWGGLVSEALNIVTAKTPTGEIDVAGAVQLIFRAFTKQDDEEQGARLGRKNAQIMERLSNMQSHQRSMMHNIRDSQDGSEKAAESASRFLNYCKQALNKGKEGYPSTLLKEVPLLDVKISLGAAQSGRCYITSKHIVFVTSYIPILGSTRSMAFDLNLIQFKVEANPTSTLMNPFPNTMDVVLKSSNESVFSFRSAIGPARLHTFITIIQGFASENKPSEYSQAGEETNEEISRLTEPQAEDESVLSV
mmetsp:Transcript_464/g.1137  ORF Transcript_464/g.1137 Transcript_464/m.1137 type:complete len:905 (+) Transcript_464:125-2839(+)